MLTRDQQIEFMERAEERVRGYFHKWLQHDEYRAALHRYDHEVHDDDEQQQALAL